MMTAAHPERILDEVIISNAAGDFDKNSTPQKRTTLQKIRARLRIPVIVDILIIVLVLALLLLLEFGFIPNPKVGFVCQDPKISFPFRGDTISVKKLLAFAYFGPFFVIGLVEILREQSFKKVRIGTVWKYYKECLIGATLVLLITEVIKVLVGEPRPHFLDSCEPDVSKRCQPGQFIFDYNCTNTRHNAFFRTDMTRSFPSGHSSLSVFIALYCSYLIQTRISTKAVSTLTKPLLIALCLTWSCVCSFSRITDRRHHWWDVLAGVFLGIGGALYTLNLLHRKEKKENEKKENETNRLSRTSTTMTILSDIKNKDATSVVI